MNLHDSQNLHDSFFLHDSTNLHDKSSREEGLKKEIVSIHHIIYFLFVPIVLSMIVSVKVDQFKLMKHFSTLLFLFFVQYKIQNDVDTTLFKSSEKDLKEFLKIDI